MTDGDICKGGSMSQETKQAEKTEKTVFSEFAEPSRPGGYEGVRQPIEVGDPASVPADGARPADDELKQAVSRALQSDGRLEGQNIETRSSAGNVELTGRVELEFQRTLAAAIAAAVPGTLSVKNQLKVAEI
ncbi:MAG: BON domain-containing protein [Rhodobacteraceae bacterium]|jgi:hyperosmotically inducible protein|nr:BON domain-containing protein [Paracoccaceae bacterium]